MEEVPRTKKKNSKSMPAAINIGAGAGRFGIGGIVLFGGALVTATIVSVLAFKTKRQRPSPSNAGKKRTSPSPETHTVDDSQNHSDGVTNMKEMQIKPIRNPIPKEKQDEDQERYVDSGFEGEEFDNRLEKIVMNCEEQVVVAAQTEMGFQSSEEDDGVKEWKCSEPIGNENDEQADVGPEKPLSSIEAVMTIDVEIQSRHVGEDQEHFLDENGKNGVDGSIPEHSDGELIDGNRIDDEVTKNKKEIEEQVSTDVQEIEILEVRAIENVKVVDQKMEIEEKIDEPAQRVGVEEQVSTDVQGIEEAKVDDQKVEGEEKDEEPAQKVIEHVSTDVQELEEGKNDDRKVEREEILEETAQKVKEHDVQTVEEAKVDDQKVEREEKGEEPAQKVEEQVSTDVQVVEAAKVDDQKVKREEKGEETTMEVQVKMSTETGFIKEEEKSKENEIALVNKEDTIVTTEVSSDGTSDVIWPDDSMQEEPTPEAKIGLLGNLKVEEKTKENKTILSKEQNDSNKQNGFIEDKGSKRASRYIEPKPWKLKLRIWSVLVSIWCLCHWYSDLPFPELSLISSFLFILILIRYQNHTTNFIKHE